MNFRIVGVAILLLIQSRSQAQNREYAQALIDTLCSPVFEGRGYTHDGALKAALFIEDEMQKIGLKALNYDYKNDFKLDVNTFPGNLSVEVNGNPLRPGKDFIVHPSSGPFNGSGTTETVKAKELSCRIRRNKAIKAAERGAFILLDTVLNSDKKRKDLRDKFKEDFKGKLLLEVSKSLTWSVGRTQKSFAHIQVLPGLIKEGDNVQCTIEAEWKTDVTALNVIGIIQGNQIPDSFILVSAHYDHLGGMGTDVYMPGANDNASGTAMMLDMANYFVENPPRYSIAFIAFGAEEAGLVGSHFLVNELEKWFHPGKIRMVVNMDLMGSGESGMMAVNGKVFTEEFELLKALNSDLQLLTDIRARGKAANSDHYFFSERGIPAFFFYLMGNYKYYHHIDDNRVNLKLGEYYDRAFKLISSFITEIQKG